MSAWRNVPRNPNRRAGHRKPLTNRRKATAWRLNGWCRTCEAWGYLDPFTPDQRMCPVCRGAGRAA
mgnify:CR=1 FL=1